MVSVMKQPEAQPHLLYLDKSTPEEFINAKLMDWVYLVGVISTQYELNFIHRWGNTLKDHDAAVAKAEREKVLGEFAELFELVGNSNYRKGNKIVSSAYYGAMVYLKRGMFEESKNEHLDEIKSLRAGGK